MNTRKLAGLAVIALVAGCRMPPDLGVPAQTKTTGQVEVLPLPKLVGVDVTAQVSSPSAQSDYRIQYALSEVSKVAIGIFERSTDSSTNPLLGYFHVGNGAATSSIQLSATEFTNFQAVLGTSISVGSAAKDAERRYLMRTFTTPLPSSMTTTLKNFPIATDSIPIHAYNIFVAAFDSYGNVLGYKEADLTYSILSQATPNIALTADLNHGGLGQINVGRTMHYGHMNATGSVAIIAGVFDAATNPQLGFTDTGSSFDISAKSYHDALVAYLNSQGLSDTTNDRRYLIKEYAAASVPTGTGTNFFSNLPVGATRYRAFMMALRNNSTEDIGHYISATATVSTGATTSITLGKADLNGVTRVETGLVETFVSNIGSPAGIAVDTLGNVYVNGSTSNIVKFNTAGNQSTVYGTGVAGWTDTASGSPQFNSVKGLAFDGQGNLYAGDCSNNAIRKITSAGTVTTVAGHGSTMAGFSDTASGTVKFNCPRGLAVDGQGTIYVADSLNHAIRKIASAGTVTTLAGTNTAGYVEGTGNAARFDTPTSVVLSSDGATLYVADSANRRVRKIVTATGATSVVAGTGSCCLGEGSDGSQVNLNTPTGLAIDTSGDLYMVETGNTGIRKISGTAPHAVSRLVTENGPGCCTPTDGPPLAAVLKYSHGIAVFESTFRTLYAAETDNNAIRKIK